jgi:Histidine kinase-, DNA gyrase B-, and HSP90-like ATPase
MATEQALSVVTDSARDLLQSADFFSNEKLVAWEYISNGLQYVDPGTSPHVDVVVDTKQKRMVVSDNGSGMTLDGLKNFFVMHGENVERKRGKPGRGRFGTGKSAAFGIASSLRITTVRDGKRSIVELTRADIEASRTGEGPVDACRCASSMSNRWTSRTGRSSRSTASSWPSSTRRRSWASSSATWPSGRTRTPS